MLTVASWVLEKRNFNPVYVLAAIDAVRHVRM